MKPIHLTVAGLHSFRDAVEVDFEHLGRHGVFGIFGAIGAGKSSLLDALTLALYGMIDRVPGRGRAGLVNHHSDRVEVRLRFSLTSGGEPERYEVHRTYRTTVGGGAERVNSRLVRLHDGDAGVDEVVADKEREVNAAVEKLLGLNAEDFMRAVVLPQGRFMRFLHLKGADRRSMLQRIFRLEAYGDGLRQRVKQRRDALDRSLEGRAGERAGLGDASRQALAEAAEAVDRADAHLAEAQDTVEALDAAWRHGEELRERAERVARAEAALAALLADEAAMRDRAAALAHAERAAELAGPAERLRVSAVAAEATERSRADAIGALTEARGRRDAAAAARDRAQAAWDALGPELTARRPDLQRAVELDQELAVDRALAAELTGRADRARLAAAEAASRLVELESRQSADSDTRRALTESLAANRLPSEHRERVLALTRAHDAVQAASRARDALDARTAPLRKRVEAAREVVEAARAGRAVADAARVEAEARLAAHAVSEPPDLTPAREAAAAWRHAVAGWSEAQAAALAATEAHATALRLAGEAALHHAVARREATRIEAELTAAEAAWAQLRHRHAAALLARDLHDGEPCPVCGGLDHPAPAEPVALDDTATSVLRAAADRAAAWRDAAAEVDAHAQGRLESAARAARSATETAGRARERAGSTRRSAAVAIAALGGPDLPPAGPDDPDAPTREVEASAGWLDRHEAELRARATREGADHRGLVDALGAARVTEERAESAVAVALADLRAADADLARLDQDLAAIRIEEGLAWEAFHAAAATAGAGGAAPTLFDVRRLQSVIDRKDAEVARCTAALAELDHAASALQGDLAAARADSAATVAEHGTATDRLEQLQGRIAATQGRIAALCPEGSPADRLLEITTTLDRLAADLRVTREAFEEANLAVQRATEAELAARGAAATAAEARRAAHDELGRTLARLGLPTDLDPATLPAHDPTLDRAAERAALAAWDHQAVALRARLAAAREELGDATLDPEAHEALAARLRSARIHLELAQAAAHAANHHQEDLSQRAARHAALGREIDVLERQLARVEQLAALLRGDRFIDFLANDHLQELVRDANVHLDRLTEGRYGLLLDPEGGFAVRDADGAGAVRPVHTLSGGETFVTSLALALALSTQVQARSRQPLEFFFLDEGFGSLDAEALDRVMSAIEALKDDARTIGLISHLPAVRERVPRYLEVRRAGRDGTTGSTVVVRDN